MAKTKQNTAEAVSIDNAIIPQQPAIVMPAVSTKEAITAWQEYLNLKNAIVDRKVDVQELDGKDFLKKSYWRKTATFFNLTVEVVSEDHEEIMGDLVWHFTCKATAPNGRSAIGTGSCSMYEKSQYKDGEYVSYNRFRKIWEPAKRNSIHNVRSTAETRAWNRAVSNLVGGGEVSAEEVDQNGHTPSMPTKDPIMEATTTPKNGKCPECGATGQFHRPDCSLK